MSEEEATNTVKELSLYNEDNYNYLKACEEFAELSELLLKKVNKRGGPKEPTDESIIEEIGDAVIRLGVLVELFGSANIEKRIDFKLSKYIDYMKDKRYKNI